MARRVIELMDDMHLSSQSTFLDYYNNMAAKNLSGAISILENNPDVTNQIMTAENINILIDNVNRRELIPKLDIDYFLEGLLFVFQRMIDNTKVLGEWDKDTQYYINNFVYYNGKEYYAYADTEPPIGTLPTDTRYWLEYNVKGEQGYGGFTNLNYLGTWSNSYNYNLYDVVVFQNKLWWAISPNIATPPNLQHYPWRLIMVPDTPNKTPIQKEEPTGYNIGDFWFKVTKGDSVEQQSWIEGTPDLAPAYSANSFKIDNNIYVVGGGGAALHAIKTNRAYDTVTDTWSLKADYPVVTSSAFGFAINGKGYCIAGADENDYPVKSCYSYNPATNTWTQIADTPEPLITVNGGCASSTKGYAVGGVRTSYELNPTMYVYDPISNKWAIETTLPAPRDSGAVEMIGDNIYIIGGTDLLNNMYGEVQIYNLTTKTWSTGKNMPTNRAYAGSFKHGKDIYVVGGLDSLSYSINVNEKYDTQTNTWTNEIPMIHKRNSLVGSEDNKYGYAIGGINISKLDIGGYVEKYQFEQENSGFEMLIDTTLGSKTVSIPMTEDGIYNYWIDWGDGFSSTQITTYNDINATHTYAVDGEYTIKLVGHLNRLLFTGDIAVDLKEVTKSTLTYSSIESMFKNCVNLTSIPSDIFGKSPSIESAHSVFEGCTKLQIIPIGLFDNNAQIITFLNAFKNTGLISIPTGLFNANQKATDFAGVFSKTKITSIPMGLFDNNSNATRFNNAFGACQNLINIPDNLFTNCPTVLTYAYCFQACYALKEIPKNLFGEALVSATTMEGIFEGCSGLSSVPEGLFQYGSSVTSYQSAFNRTQIKEIPNNFFNGVNATTSYIFDTSKIISLGENSLKGLNIPTGFFQNNTVLKTVGENALSESYIEDMNNIFNGCTALTDLGNWDLSNITTGSGDCFKGCTNLTNLSGFKDKKTLTQPTIKNDFSLIDCSKLTHKSLENLIDSLVTNTSTTIKTLTLNKASLDLLSIAEKLEIINKYWNISGYNPTNDLNENVARELVQLTKGNDNVQAVNYLTTNLYYYVRLLNSARTSEISGLYAVDKTTGIMYDYNDIPTSEYVIYGKPISGTGKYYFITKNETGDQAGASFKANIGTFLTANPTYTVLRIGDNGDSQFKIKNSGFEQLKNGSELFKGNTQLTSINVYGQFSPTDVHSMFEGCSNLSAISFENFENSGAPNMSRMFYGCTKLASTANIPMVHITNASEMYRNSGIKTISLQGATNLRNAQGMFRGCTNLTEVQNANSLFGNNSNLEDVSYLFEGCTNLKSVGTHNVMSLSTSTGAPIWVINRTALNNQLFANCKNVKNMSYMFANCTNLGSNKSSYETQGIPMGIFYGCPMLENISHVFDGCKNINVDMEMGIEMNKVLFSQNPNLKDVSYAFANTRTTFIGENTSSIDYTLFPVQTKIENASYLWYNCEMTDATGIETIPFIYKSKTLKNIEGMFKGQTFARQLPAMDTSSTSGFDWGKLNEICPALENCSQMFYGNTKLTETASGSVLTLINTLSKITTLNNHAQAFTNCTQLTNYNNIPAGWK